MNLTAREHRARVLVGSGWPGYLGDQEPEGRAFPAEDRRVRGGRALGVGVGPVLGPEAEPLSRCCAVPCFPLTLGKSFAAPCE